MATNDNKIISLSKLSTFKSKMEEVIDAKLVPYSTIANTVKSCILSMDPDTYIISLSLYDANGIQIGPTQAVDLPVESVVVSGTYDKYNQKIVLTLQNGTTVDVPVGDLIAGLQTEITAVNKLSSDLIEDNGRNHLFVSAAEKLAWNAKSNFSGSYNDLTDKPTIGNGALIIQKNGTQIGTSFTANQTAETVINIPVPTSLAGLSDDSTHRLVTDTEKTTWNNKQDALNYATDEDIEGLFDDEEE